MTEWWRNLKRSDCRFCVHKRECGDIFPEEGKCPANSGSEKWAYYQGDKLVDIYSNQYLIGFYLPAK